MVGNNGQPQRVKHTIQGNEETNCEKQRGRYNYDVVGCMYKYEK